jgi:hypothetical protein
MSKLLVIMGFVLAFGAGLAMGPQLWQRSVAAPTTRPGHQVSWLKAELNLSAEQQDQMEKIWAETAHRAPREQADRRRQLARERDEAIAALVRPEDQEKYSQALKTFSEGNAALEREWRNYFANGVERTKAILTPELRRNYEELLKNGGAERAAREREQGRRVDERATSRPGSEK